MKLRIAIPVFVLIIISMGDAYGADWNYVFSSKDGETDVWIDVGSISHPSKDTVRVWIKAVYRFDSPYLKQGIEYSLQLAEINCKEKQIAILSSTLYGKKGNTPSYSNPAKIIWEFIVPDSIGELLHTFVCGTK